jgi:hypothetical protein
MLSFFEGRNGLETDRKLKLAEDMRASKLSVFTIMREDSDSANLLSFHLVQIALVRS